MPYMPSLTSESLDLLKYQILNLRRGRSGNRKKPHKLLMLLAVLDMAESGLLPQNRIYFSRPLIERFEKYFRLYANPSDWCQPGPPFFHLRSSGFWFLKAVDGREEILSNLGTVGGGTRRITDNIEYAYLTEVAYESILCNKERSELFDFLITLLRENNELKINGFTLLESKSKICRLENFIDTIAMEFDSMSQRLKTVFHLTFPLSRSSVRQVVRIISENHQGPSIKSQTDLLREYTSLGTKQAEAMPRYGVGTGLMDDDAQLTRFGTHAFQNDPMLEQTGTQWLMHYHMSASHGPGPAYWHELVATRFRAGDEFTSGEIAEQINDFLERTEGRRYSESSISGSASVFLSTYSRLEGLGRLGLLEEVETGRYRVLQPEYPSPWVLGYALVDYWRANYGDRLAISLETLYGEHSLGGIFMLGPGRLNSLLRTLQGEGIVEVHRFAPPYEVVLLKREVEPLLEKLYGAN